MKRCLQKRNWCLRDNVNKPYIFITILLFVIEVLIALFINDTFIRPFVGDVLVVMLLFSLVRIFYSGNGVKLAVAILLFSFLIELSQYYRLIEFLGVEEIKLAQIILGFTFDEIDLIAYTVGILISFYLDKMITPRRLTIRHSNRNSQTSF